ncbi:MAG: NADH-quinone oxidoreductase subunit F [Candidatus Aenigmarchaeota archaeon]|nr:NADH-quinone oxidoreductase subunit F [Candidatus Aenigmarchaeota archaeon]
MQLLTNTCWRGYEKALKRSPKKVIGLVKESGLRGRSGSNYPTGQKWESMGKGERYLVCNADEGEPGTFKDRFIMENNPSLLIEGMAIAAYAMGIRRAWIYLRGEYSYIRPKLEAEIKKSSSRLKKIGLRITVVLGAGAYLCGEESAILESMEGNRPIVRRKPPYPVQAGLNGRPTCVNNVETLATIPLILDGTWNPELTVVCLSGDLQAPGVYEAKLGTPLGEIIAMGKPKEEPKAVYFGASAGCLPYKNFRKMPFDEKSFSGTGAMMGSRALIVVGQNRSIPEVSKIFAEFFVHESCGYCTPCREGNFRVLEALRKMRDKKSCRSDLKIIQALVPDIRDTSYCTLGRFSTTHLECALRYFKKEFLEVCR